MEVTEQGEIVKIGGKLKNSQFKKESDLLKHLIENIDSFCKDIFNDEVISFKSEVLTEELSGERRYKNHKRIDVLIYGKKKNYVIELKNPTCQSDNRYAIGQVLNYGREIENAELIIISTMFDLDTIKTIRYYNLPIKYYLLQKGTIFEFIGELEK